MPLMTRKKSDPAPTCDPFALQHMTDHPTVRPFIEHKEDIAARQGRIQAQLTEVLATLRHLEHDETTRLSQPGADFAEPQTLTDAKAQVRELERTSATLDAALQKVNEDLQTATARAKKELLTACKRLMIEPLEQYITCLEHAVPHARQLQNVMAQARRLAGVDAASMQHLSMLQPQGLDVLRKTLGFLRAAAQGGDDAE